MTCSRVRNGRIFISYYRPNTATTIGLFEYIDRCIKTSFENIILRILIAAFKYFVVCDFPSLRLLEARAVVQSAVSP